MGKQRSKPPTGPSRMQMRVLFVCSFNVLQIDASPLTIGRGGLASPVLPCPRLFPLCCSRPPAFFFRYTELVRAWSEAGQMPHPRPVTAAFVFRSCNTHVIYNFHQRPFAFPPPPFSSRTKSHPQPPIPNYRDFTAPTLHLFAALKSDFASSSPTLPASRAHAPPRPVDFCLSRPPPDPNPRRRRS